MIVPELLYCQKQKWKLPTKELIALHNEQQKSFLEENTTNIRTPQQRAKIGKYVAENGPMSAAKHLQQPGVFT